MLPCATGSPRCGSSRPSPRPRSLAALAADDVQHVLLEGGPTLAAAFLRAGLVDGVIWYLAPKILGSGAQAVGDSGSPAIDSALRLEVTGITRVGQDVRMDGRMVPGDPS